MTEHNGYAHPEALVDAEWVQAHRADSTVRLIEVDVDTTAYEQGHIPGAIGFNWQRELQDQVMRAPVSKEQLTGHLIERALPQGADTLPLPLTPLVGRKLAALDDPALVVSTIVHSLLSHHTSRQPIPKREPAEPSLIARI